MHCHRFANTGVKKHHQEDEIYLYPPGRHSAIHWLCRRLALVMCVLRKCSLISLGISVTCRTVECKIVNGCCRKRRSPLLTELWCIPASGKQTSSVIICHRWSVCCRQLLKGTWVNAQLICIISGTDYQLIV